MYALSTKQWLSEAVHLTRTLSLFNSTLGIGNHFSYLGFNTVSLPSPWDGKEEKKKKKSSSLHWETSSAPLLATKKAATWLVVMEHFKDLISCKRCSLVSSTRKTMACEVNLKTGCGDGRKINKYRTHRWLFPRVVLLPPSGHVPIPWKGCCYHLCPCYCTCGETGLFLSASHC